MVHGNNNEIYCENNIVLGNGVKINKKIDRPYNMKTKTIIKEIYLYEYNIIKIKKINRKM